MTTRFSEPEAAEIDAARGNTDRSEWLRDAALTIARAAVRKRTPPSANPDQPAAIAANCPHRLPPGAYCKTCDRA